jgi:tripartite ATP-independent transporter DctM subunit
MELLIYFLLLLALILIGVPIAFSLLISAAVYVICFSTLDPIIIPQKMQYGLNLFVLLAIPFFLMLGEVMGRAGITGRLVDLANAIVGHVRGGMAHVNIVTSMLMAGIQGTAAADTAAVGSMLIPAMKKDKYEPNFAAAITAASSAIGPIIPPSLAMVIYGSLGNVSVGRLFLGGAIPGFILGIYLMIYSYLVAKKRNYGSSHGQEGFSIKRLGRSLKAGFLPLLIPIIIIGGIVGGVFTATESGAVATMVAIILGVFVYRRLGWKELVDSVRSTIYMMGSVLIIIAAAATFGWILSIEGAGDLLSESLYRISKNPILIMLIMNALLLILGCFIETVALLILLTPILLPVAVKVGYDPVHFGVIMVFNLTIGLTTPPLGLCIFIASGIAGISVKDFMREMFFLYVPLILGLLTTVFLPKLVMFLPHNEFYRSLIAFLTVELE